MSNLALDKEAVKAAVKELIAEDPKFGIELFEEIKEELKKEFLDKIIDENFKEYEEVFKALA